MITGEAIPNWTLRTFSADVTIPLGHPCMGGGISPARLVVDPLEAIGFVLAGGSLDRPIVFVSLDWCEIRNDAYDGWRSALADAAGTDPERVLVTSIHQHEAPVVDPEAQRAPSVILPLARPRSAPSAQRSAGPATSPPGSSATSVSAPRS